MNPSSPAERAPGRPGRVSPLAALSLLIVLWTGGLFAYSVQVRAPWFGELAQPHWITASAVKFSEYWYEDGPWALRFAMMENPRSIEFPDLASRAPYISYMPGSIVPIYVLAKLQGRPPTHSLVMAANLGNHLAIALCLGLALCVLLLRAGFRPAAVLPLVLVPAPIVLLTPSPMFNLQNAYFADQAVLLPFAVLALLEVLRGSSSPRVARWAAALQLPVGVWGLLCDWLFVFVWLALYAKSWAEGELKGRWWRGTLRFAAVPFTVLALFGAQVVALDGVGMLRHKLLFRTGLGDGGEAYIQDFVKSFWTGWVEAGYGLAGKLLLLLATGLLLVCGVWAVLRRRRGQLDARSIAMLGFAGLMVVPCFAQIYALKNHSAIHEFSALKLVLPLATVPFVLLPLLGLSLAGRAPLRSRWGVALGWGLLLAAAGYVYSVHPGYLRLFSGIMPHYAEIGHTIRSTVTFEDVVFSPDVEAEALPPHLLSYTGKRIYRVSTPAEAHHALARMSPQARPVLLFLKPPSGEWAQVAASAERLTTPSFEVYRLASRDQLQSRLPDSSNSRVVP